MTHKPVSRIQGKQCLDTAFRLLSRRDHSRAELCGKLKERGFSEDQIHWAIEQCRRYDYLDDGRFAHNHARQLQRRGYGIRRIRQSLRVKGLAGDLIEDAIMRHCTEQAQMEQCCYMLRKKIRPIQNDRSTPTVKPKLYRYLLGRGFSPAIITAVLEKTLEDINR